MAAPIYAFTRKEIILLLAVFILGLVTGATLLNIVLSRQIDALILENKELHVKLNEQEAQIKQLEEKKDRYEYIRKITVKLDSDLNQHTQQEIKESIRQKLAGYYGKEISLVEPLLLRDIIHDRYLMVGDKIFHLQLVYLVIQEEMKVYLKVGVQKSGEGPEG